MQKNLNVFSRNEGGQVFLEFAVALPALTLLIVITVTTFIFCIKCYRNNLANLELQSEVRIAAERIVEDALRSKTFAIEKGTLSQTPGSRLLLKRVHTGTTGIEEEVTYFLRDDASGKEARLCRNAYNAPITGADNHSEVTITNFTCTQKGKCLRVEITGKSAVTDKTFSLVTGIYFAGM